MADFTSRVALVTGAGHPEGIGYGIVRRFLKCGARGVVFTDVDVEAAARASAELADEFGSDRAVFVRHDVTSPDDWRQALETAVGRFGGLDILVNNAGASFPGTFSSLSLADFRRTLSVNVESQFLGIQTCMAALIDRAPLWDGGGAIINNSSAGAYLADTANIAYNTSKAASRMLTMCAARELGPKKVRVNSVHFGVIMTPMVRRSLEHRVAIGQHASVEEALAFRQQFTPLNRVGSTEDAAAIVSFLASDEARYIHGAAYLCDGGLVTQY